MHHLICEVSIKNKHTIRLDLQKLQALRRKINAVYLEDETKSVEALLVRAKNTPIVEERIKRRAQGLVEQVRGKLKNQETVDAFIYEYSLSNEEGVVLMCLAEALLRIPDNHTADRLIRDKIAPANWHKHKGVSRSLFVNASTWGLMLTGRIVNVSNSMTVFASLVLRIGEPVVRTVLRQAMRVMGGQYVMGESIEDALARSQREFHQRTRFSFDMLGEAALSSQDVETYFFAYQQAILAIGKYVTGDVDFVERPSISIKLSALHPRYEVFQSKRVVEELTPRVLSLVILGREQGVAVTLDAEEADRLDLSLTIFQSVKLEEKIKDWNGFGLAVQAYQKRACAVLEYLHILARMSASQIPIRLVKGAYWDTEIKRAQEQGLDGYPVFTRKAATDVSYLACAKYLLQHTDEFYPQFATHNAHTLAAVLELSGESKKYEFQRLHGMGGSLYADVIDKTPCRVYAPVGSYENLLPYLVRRLLENGANSSFVNRLENESIPMARIVESPARKILSYDVIPNQNIPLPKDLFQGRRKNSLGLNLSDETVFFSVLEKIGPFRKFQWEAMWVSNNRVDVVNPANKNHTVGFYYVADEIYAKQCLLSAIDARDVWKKSSVANRISIISAFVGFMQQHAVELYSLLIFESGKTLKDAIGEWREAIDFCYYYMSQSKKLFSTNEVLPGPTGEENAMQFCGRGVFICISPWNFPLAIFVGQVVAALLSGNVVIAKPSSNTSLIASRVVELLYQAGVPREVLHYLPCSGATLSHSILSHPQIDGVVFTGSFETALDINQKIAARVSPIIPLIAETGGLNAMIVDSSALPEQVVKDVLTSAFNSAGQRCSALRVLIIQSDVYEDIATRLVEALHEWVVGDPLQVSTDVPPVIDRVSKEKLEQYKAALTSSGQLLFEFPLRDSMNDRGNFVSPAIFKIESLSALREEQFGPILHVMSYDSDDLTNIVNDINALGYGLTLGVHSRINETIDYITKKANVGNLYVNRNMVGAVVGVQPFGGEGLSGTGPKAGGPNYLQRFCTEKTISVNTSAVGGNATLLALGDE